MCNWIYQLRPARLAMLTEGPTPGEAEAVSRHFAHLSALVERGVVQLAGRSVDDGPDTFGLVLFHAADESAARALLESDPAVQAGVMTARLWPFRVALVDPGGFAPSRRGGA